MLITIKDRVAQAAVFERGGRECLAGMEKVLWVKAPGPEEVAEPAILREPITISLSGKAPGKVSAWVAAPVLEPVWVEGRVVPAGAPAAGVAGATEEARPRRVAQRALPESPPLQEGRTRGAAR